MPCRSSRASIARRPRFGRSAVARSTPAKLSSGGGAGGVDCGGGLLDAAGAAVWTEAVPAALRARRRRSVGGLRRGKGTRSRATRRHRSRSSAWSAFGGRRIFDQHDMEAARAVRAELDALLDIAGARRAGDHVYRARQGPRVASPHFAPTLPSPASGGG